MHPASASSAPGRRRKITSGAIYTLEGLVSKHLPTGVEFGTGRPPQYRQQSVGVQTVGKEITFISEPGKHLRQRARAYVFARAAISGSSYDPDIKEDDSFYLQEYLDYMHGRLDDRSYCFLIMEIKRCIYPRGSPELSSDF